MLTEKDYCDKDLSASLMEMGFRGFGHFYYEKGNSKLKATNQFLTVRTAKALGHTLAISLYVAQKWLREEHDIHIEILYQPACWSGKMYNLKKNKYIKGFTFFESFEDALNTLIKEAVKILKEKEK